MNWITKMLQHSAFGVCNYLGDKMGLSSARVRLYFIYATFVALGSPVIFYLVAAFWLNLRRYVKHDRKTVWE